MKRILAELIIGALLIGGTAWGTASAQRADEALRHRDAVWNCQVMILHRDIVKAQRDGAVLDRDYRKAGRLAYEAQRLEQEIIHLPSPVVKEAIDGLIAEKR